ncbi:MAG: ribosomal-processing cysteine protease Prp [Bacilli bacterium]|nr:ribosomal-processing cysteine protease Prp [Bacilli bacterium]
MIKLNVKNDKIIITGHALYDDYGKDIVCASASSIIISSINCVLQFDKDALSYHENKDGLEIEILKKDKITLTIIKNMLDMLKDLASQYEENIKIIGG